MNKSGIAEAVIAHPTGGGAIRGIGETFSPDLHTGTGNLTVPIAIPPGRNGFAPELALVYSSGQGNGPFGVGWQLGIPGVMRDTRSGVPSYRDADDSFVLSGMERLVAMGATADGGVRYRPRTEGGFVRIVHRVSDRDDFWEVRTRSGVVSRYGTPGMRGSDPATVRDPDDPRRVFAWSLAETVDPFGNRIEYLYERDPVQDDGPHHWDQVRLATIRYADHGARDAPQFLVTIDFTYAARPDPFSSYRAGFEIRTLKRCTRIEVQTHGEATQLSRAYQLTYRDEASSAPSPNNGFSLLSRIDAIGVDGQTQEALPPLTFDYTELRPEQRVYRPMSASAGGMPERSLAHPDFELADLFGRGLPDVIQLGDERRYWKNLGEGRFDLPRPFEGLPSGVQLGSPGTQLADLDGDGQIDLLVVSPELAGYLPLSPDGAGEARAFVPYTDAPPFALDDPELRLIDLDGDGVTDALRTGENLELYLHDAERGWSNVELRARDAPDRFPDVYFSDPRVRLADMTGDGLTDLVLVDAGRVDYWPSLGHGRWGRRVTMAGTIAFADAVAFGGQGFDPKRVLLGDIDGDGLADLVYVESGRVTIWLNQSGNGWSEPIVVAGTPPIADPDAVRLADMLGTGTAGILWTYDARSFADSTYKFLDLTGGVKPYLLCGRDNHAGARTRVAYAPSTRYGLADEPRPETRWRARLPFPVQVVSRVEAIDALSGGKLTSELRYHQGAWDGVEREFRGFGVVEQLDTESFPRYAARGLHGGEPFAAVDPARFSPPTLTRTWFHQGSLQDRGGSWIEAGLAEAAAAPGDSPTFAADQRVELGAIARAAAQGGDARRLRDAVRALRGAVLRRELYALDDSPRSARPYTVSESLHDVREIEPDDPSATTRQRVFFAFEVGSRETRWERGTDPMTHLTFTGGHDAYGMPHTRLAIAVPRGRDPLVTSNESVEPYLASYTVTDYARRDDAIYLVDRVARTTEYEVENDGRPDIFALRDAIQSGAGVLRVLGHERTYYDGDAFVGLPIGQLGEFGAPVRREVLAFTDEHLTTMFDASDPRALGPSPGYLDATAPTSWGPEYPAAFRTGVPPLAGYAHYIDGDVVGSPAGYYVIAERRRYDFHEAGAVPRGLARSIRDPLGADTAIDYDTYALFATRVTDPVGLVTEATYDERVLLPQQIVDPNGTRTQLDYSPLGMLAAQYVRGAAGEGDLEHPSLQLEYDLQAFEERGAPISVRSTRREHHDSEAEIPAADRDRTIATIEYSDGFGRLLQTRVQAEDTRFGDPTFGGGVLAQDPTAPDASVVARAITDPVVVSGWQTYDNKGRVVERYEPFLAQGWEYRAPEGVELGQKARLFYDARGQLVRTQRPDGSEQLVVLGAPDDLADPSSYAPTPWETYTYDANDNAGRTHGTAASAFEDHWNTPASITVDALGRTIATVVRNGPDPAKDWFTTRSTYDLPGNLVAITDALGREAFRYVYDLAKRCWRVDSIDAGRRDTVLDALGQPMEVRDAKGARTLRAYDVLHRPARVWARDNGAATITLRQVRSYGDGGSVAQSASARAAAQQAKLLGRLASQHDEAGVLAIGAYDFKGNVVESSRRVIADAPIIADLAASAGTGWNVPAFVVDWEPGAGKTLGDVEASLVETASYRTSTTYDALNRAKRVQLPEDVQGQRHELRPTYNRAGGLEQLLLDGAPYVQSIAYDARGQRTLVAYGNGVVTRSAYDPQTFRLVRRRTERFTQPDPSTYAPAGGVLQDALLRYDLAGNLLAITDRAPGSGVLDNPDAANADPALGHLLASGDALIRRFHYDPLYRLVSATGRECDAPPSGPPWLDAPRCTDLTRTRGYTEQYGYDAMGNLLRLSHQSAGGGFVRDFAVEPTSNRLHALQIGDTQIAYAYDPAGNTLSETSSRRLSWNHADQLATFRAQAGNAEPSVYAQYLYDAAGQRVKKLVRRQGGAVEVTHYIDGTFEHHRWGSGSTAGENNHVHVFGGSQRVAIVRVGAAAPGDTGPAVQYHLCDQVGSSTTVVDASGALVNREDFTPYGETSFGSFARKRYRFTGMERDEESSLSYHGARYYAPWLARWTSPDPLGWRGGVNLYGYVAQNPIASADRSGLDPEIDKLNRQIDTNGDKLISLQEFYSAFSGTSATTTMTPNAWFDQMARDGHGYRVDENLRAIIAARHQASVTTSPRLRPPTSEELAFSQTHDYGIAADGTATPSTADAELLAYDLIHPSARIARNEKTLAVTAVCLWQPEVVSGFQLAHGFATGDEKEVRAGLLGLAGGVIARGASATASIARITPGSLPAAEEASLLGTLGHIDAGTTPTGPLAKKWGTQFKNWAGDLPGARGPSSPYLEYRVAPPSGTSGAGTLRVVSNPKTGEIFYTWTHYGNTGAPAFVRIR